MTVNAPDNVDLYEVRVKFDFNVTREVAMPAIAHLIEKTYAAWSPPQAHKFPVLVSMERVWDVNNDRAEGIFDVTFYFNTVKIIGVDK